VCNRLNISIKQYKITHNKFLRHLITFLSYMILFHRQNIILKFYTTCTSNKKLSFNERYKFHFYSISCRETKTKILLVLINRLDLLENTLLVPLHLVLFYLFFSHSFFFWSGSLVAGAHAL